MDFKFKSRHNQVAFLDLSHPEVNDEWRIILGFLINSNIKFAISESPDIKQDVVQEFWRHAQYSEVNGVRTVTSTVQGELVVITEAVIREILRFDDEGGIQNLELNVIQSECKRVGYEGDFPDKMVKKTRFSHNFRYLVHVLVCCLSGRSGGFDVMNQSMAIAFVCMITGRRFNYSGFILDNMQRMLQGNATKFLLYPRFLQIILQVLIPNLVPEGDTIEVEKMNWKIMNNMKKAFGKARVVFSGDFTAFDQHMIDQAQIAIHEFETYQQQQQQEPLEPEQNQEPLVQQPEQPQQAQQGEQQQEEEHHDQEPVVNQPLSPIIDVPSPPPKSPIIQQSHTSDESGRNWFYTGAESVNLPNLVDSYISTPVAPVLTTPTVEILKETAITSSTVQTYESRKNKGPGIGVFTVLSLEQRNRELEVLVAKQKSLINQLRWRGAIDRVISTQLRYKLIFKSLSMDDASKIGGDDYEKMEAEAVKIMETLKESLKMYS